MQITSAVAKVSENDNKIPERGRQLQEFKEPESPRSSSPHIRSSAEWITCFCLISFDTNKGQFLDKCYPEKVFDTKEANNIAFSSFPDINIGHGSTEFVYNYVIRTENGTEMHAACMFRQDPDPSQERGSVQRSLAVLSRHPFPAFLTQIICAVGPLYFQFGVPALEQALSNVDSWPKISYGKSFQLSLSGDILSVDVPYDVGIPREDDVFSPVLCTSMAKFPEQIVYRSQLYTLHTILPDLWQIWELLLLDEPIVIFSGSPCESADAVLSLIDLIVPLHYNGECRPFMTVNDTDYARIFGGKSGVVVGVTNPLALCSWNGAKVMLAAARKRKENFKNEVITNTKPLLKIDTKHVLAEVSAGSSPAIVNDIITRHFRGLTAMMLAPLDQYMTSLMPRKEVSILQEPPTLGKFSEDDFIKSLARPIFKGKHSDEIFFYRKFLRTSIFASWFRMRRGQARAKLMDSYLKALHSAEMSRILAGKNELVAVDLYVRLQSFKQKAVTRTDDEKQLGFIDESIDLVLNLLPPDLQRSMKRGNSPQKYNNGNS